ncbi:nucleotide sugar dehydrogenase [Bacillus cereus]|uniref:nucleotide sugar dehydrogenase n=1 Tax=Bacillus cereus TaxID=1396 RepID=UPI002AC008A1|nr:nucleotide sugar dehydrogenase [Bacillus cereus]MDZ4631604.1 nucleotide sugar dehydrogenase [Bacillus cereus]
MIFVEDKELTEVCIVGLGYVGITLAGAFLAKGQKVFGVEVKQEVRNSLKDGSIHLFEPGVEEVIQKECNDKLIVSEEIPNNLKNVIICVGTPYSKEHEMPYLEYLISAVKAVRDKMTSETLIVIRSTLPVGVTREVVIPILQNSIDNPKVVFAPERTIQGKALEELLSLPQVIGTDNDKHFEEAKILFEKLGVEIVRVDSFETAEMLKLMCNAHTDTLYSFGNEMAKVSEGYNVDIHEMVQAANHNYPRPNIAVPGYVGGSCLTKDPYHLIYSARQKGYFPKLIKTARENNELLVGETIEKISGILKKKNIEWNKTKVFVSGLAYKGRPETDDLRGSAIWEVLKLIEAKKVADIFLHDFVIEEAKIQKEFDKQVVSFKEGFESSNIIIILNNHPKYKNEFDDNQFEINKDAIIFDVWGILKDKFKNESEKKYEYLGVGFHG